MRIRRREVEEPQEARVPKVLSDPRKPTLAEVKAHNVNHLPYRSWCPHCVRGKGKSLDHKRLDQERDHVIPTVSMDYCFMGKDEDESTMPILVLRDHGTKKTFSHVVPSKGTKHPYVCKQCVHDLDTLGYSNILFNRRPEVGDKESASRGHNHP